MDIARMLNVTILACLLILTGCFGLFDDGDVIDDADGEDTDSGSTTVVNNHYYNNTTTALTGTPPEVHVVGFNERGSPVPLYDSDEEIIGYSGYNLTLFYSMLDVDGTITTAGIDIDLNGVVDVPVGYPRGHVNLTIPISEWESCWLAIEPCEEQRHLITTIAFIATDDDGLSTVEIMTFFGPTYDDGGWNGGSNMYVLTAQDHSDDVESDAGLMTLTFDNDDDDDGDLDWALVQIEIIKDSVPTTCDNPDLTGGNCGAAQYGGDNGMYWENGETIILTSTGGAFCTEDCTLTVRVKYNGDVIMMAAVHMN